VTAWSPVTDGAPASAVVVPVACPRCRSLVVVHQPSRSARRNTTAQREREGLLECTNPQCHHLSRLYVELVDADLEAARGLTA